MPPECAHFRQSRSALLPLAPLVPAAKTFPCGPPAPATVVAAEPLETGQRHTPSPVHRRCAPLGGGEKIAYSFRPLTASACREPVSSRPCHLKKCVCEERQTH